MTALVVDASVAIKWYVREADSAEATRILASPLTLYAPALLRLEVANGLWKQWRRKLVSAEHVAEAMAILGRTINVWSPVEPLLDAALKLSLALDHPIYDCLYLALAEKLDAPLVSADQRLLALAPKGAAIALKDWQS